MPSSAKTNATSLPRMPLPIHGEPKPAAKPAKDKRATLPLDDRLALAELSEALTGGVRDKLDGVARQLRRIADALESGNHGKRAAELDPNDEIPY